MSTHPPSEERVQQMHELAATTPAGKMIVNTTSFGRAKQIAVGMGKKPRQP